MFVERASFSELIDAAFGSSRSFAGVLLPAAVVYDGIGSLVVELALPAVDASVAPIRFANSVFLTGFLGFLGSYAISAGLVRLALGQPLSPLDVLAAPWREARFALPLGFLLSLLGLVGFLLGVLPVLLVEILLLVVGPVAAVEHSGAFETLRRAWELAEGHRLRAAGLYGFVVLGVVATSLPLLVSESPDAVPVLAVTAVLQALVAYFGDVAVFLFYADLRVRKEACELLGLAPHVARREATGD